MPSNSISLWTLAYELQPIILFIRSNPLFFIHFQTLLTLSPSQNLLQSAVNFTQVAVSLSATLLFFCFACTALCKSPSPRLASFLRGYVCPPHPYC